MPDIDPDTALRIAKTIADMYGDAANRMLQLVASRLAGGIDQPGWAEAKLAELLHLRADAQAVVNGLTADAPTAITAAITDANSIGANAAAIELDLAPVVNHAAVKALASETVGTLTSTHPGILRSTLDAYRSIIADTSAADVVTGTATRVQATQRALDRFADRGITGFTDSAGRQWELESYAEMATRTAAGRAMVDGRTEAYRQDGRSLVIVSSSPQECSACRPFEGKLLSLTGEHVGDRVGGIRVVNTLAGARSAGFQHPNCRHDVRPYIDGLTTPMTHTADPDGDAARQTQRYLERGIRQWRRRASVALDDNAKGKADAAVKAWRARLAEHVQANDLKRMPGRERIGSGR